MRGGEGERGKDGPSSEASWTIQSCKSKAKQLHHQQRVLDELSTVVKAQSDTGGSRGEGKKKRGDSRVGIAELDKPKLSRRVDDQILRDSRDMSHTHRRPLEELDDKVSISSSEERVLGDGVEPEFGCEEVSVDEERVTGESSGTEREDGNSGDELLESGQIGRERKCVRQEEVRPPDGLSSLKVGVPRHQHVDLLLGSGNHDVKKVLHVPHQHVGFLLEPESEVGCDLVVSGSTGVELASDVLADELGETTFVGRVDVFVVGGGNELGRQSDVKGERETHESGASQSNRTAPAVNDQ